MNTNTQRKVFELNLTDLREEEKTLSAPNADLKILIGKKEKQLEQFNIQAEHLTTLEKELIYTKGFESKQHIRNAITATNEALITIKEDR